MCILAYSSCATYIYMKCVILILIEGRDSHWQAYAREERV